MKLNEIRGLPPLVTGVFGIEVEVEGRNLPELDNKFWSTHQDGSLRGESFEYVTKGAVKVEEVKQAVSHLNACFKKRGSELSLSFRTSVHVHMNVGEMELDKILSIIYLYYLFEEPLVQFCGQERIGNRFCLRLRDSEEIVNNIRYAFRDGGINIRRLDQNAMKYAALNLVPMRTYGSIEFRSMRGTVDTDTIVTWTTLLNCLRTSEFKTAKEVYEYLDTEGVQNLADKVFGEHFKFIAFEGWKNEVERNASLMIEIPHRISFKEVKKEAIKGLKLDKLIIDDAVNRLERAFRIPPVAHRAFEAPAPIPGAWLQPVINNEVDL